jgi:hypothetical protein
MFDSVALVGWNLLGRFEVRIVVQRSYLRKTVIFIAKFSFFVAFTLCRIKNECASQVNSKNRFRFNVMLIGRCININYNILGIIALGGRNPAILTK